MQCDVREKDTELEKLQNRLTERDKSGAAQPPRPSWRSDGPDLRPEHFDKHKPDIADTRTTHSQAHEPERDKRLREIRD